MRLRFPLVPAFAITLVVLAFAPAALADPASVAVYPPNGARFLPGQRFDIRVEGKGAAPFSASLSINGHPVSFTSGTADPVATDGISPAGWGGFNRRGYWLGKPGTYTLSATFKDGSGQTATANASITVESIGDGDGWGDDDDHDGGKRGGEHGKDRGIKNVIIYLGDGMGAAHRTAARIVSKGVTAGVPNGPLAMDTMPGVGLIHTHSLNSIVTDSAPGMGCYTTGNHSRNNQEGVWPANVTNPFYAPRVEYLGHYLHRTRGTSLGIVTTADIEDATPAANAVFTQARGNGTGICDQYLDESDPTDSRAYGTGLRVLMGGGRRWFTPSDKDTGNGVYSSRAAGTDYDKLPADLVAKWGLPPEAAGTLDPTRNLTADFQAAGFSYADSKTKLNQVLDSRPERILGLFAWGNMNAAVDKLAERRYRAGIAGYTDQVVRDHQAPDQPLLEEMTSAALSVLKKNRKGFVLMVEGAHIDKQSHQMDAERAIGETIEFDKAIGVGLEFARKDGRTLVLVTADHECSGFSLIGALTGGVAGLKALPPDTATLDPATAPKRQGLVGTYDNAGFPTYPALSDGYPASFDVDGKLLVGFGASGDRYENWLTPSKPSRESLTPTKLATELGNLGYASNIPITRDEKKAGYFIRGQAVGQEQAVHTASDIPLSAYARDQDAWLPFAGTYQNIDVFFKIAQVLSR
ncbi:MAG TPA: alkaline phosphatase [Myxococcaceae bacterium]|nr:alkaline phosphatase [Myxococcaceae bacterium]